MGRVLSNDPCRVVFNDQISGTLIGVYYRRPTNDERLAYFAELTPKPGPDAETDPNPAEVRARYGGLIITGFDEGAFSALDKKSVMRPISAAPASANYDPDWKAKVAEFASDILGLLGLFVFENALRVVPGGAPDPFAPTSSGSPARGARQRQKKSARKSSGNT